MHYAVAKSMLCGSIDQVHSRVTPRLVEHDGRGCRSNPALPGR
jgi:hypothetical protein